MILLTGKGLVGSHLADKLLEKGLRLTLISKSPLNRPSKIQVESEYCVDLADASQVLSIKCWEDVSCVIHTAALVHQMKGALIDEYYRVNVEGTLNLARAAIKAGVQRFIYISSIKVNGEATDGRLPFNADEVIEPPSDPYGRSKYDAEKALLQLGEESELEVVIIRPPLVYGYGVKANFNNMLQWVSTGIPLPLGAINNKRSMVHIDNLCSLIATCVDHPAAAGQVFLVSDDSDLSTTELLKKVAVAQGVKSRLIPVPVWLLRFGSKCFGRGAIVQRLCGSLQVDITKTKKVLNWQPHVTPDQGLAQTVRNPHS